MSGAVRFLVGSFITGEILDEVPFATYGATRTLNRPGGWEATLDLNDRRAPLLVSAPGPMALAVWAERDGVILNGGWLMDADANADDNNNETLRVGGQGRLALYRDGRRHVRSKTAMTAAEAIPNANVAWDDVDLFDIAVDLVRHAEAFTAEPPIDIVRAGPGGSTDAGVTADLALNSWERKGIGEQLEELSDAPDGFDFAISWRWNHDTSPATITPTLTFAQPAGRRLDLLLRSGKNVRVASWQRAGGELATFAEALGAGEGRNMVIGSASDINLAWPGGIYPRLEAVVDAKDLKRQRQVDRAAAGELAWRRSIPETLTLTLVEDIDAALGTFDPGDHVTVDIEWGALTASGWWRIVETTFDLDADGSASIGVTLTPSEVYE